jgi:hypothetical protein
MGKLAPFKTWGVLIKVVARVCGCTQYISTLDPLSLRILTVRFVALVVGGAAAETKAPRERRLMMEFHNNILDIMVDRCEKKMSKCLFVQKPKSWKKARPRAKTCSLRVGH